MASAARFTAGDSKFSLNGRRDRDAEPNTKGNTMKGMPGYVRTDTKRRAHAGESGARGGASRAIPPAKAREIGERGGSAKRMDEPGKKAHGTMAKNLHTTGTGRITKSSDQDFAKNALRVKGVPAHAQGKMPGGPQKTHVAHARQAKGSGGMMERLKGRVKTSSERGAKRSSMMY